MFEKYKERGKERGFLGMTRKEVIMLLLLALFAILCLVFISFQITNVPKKRAEQEGVIVPAQRRAGDREALREFEAIKEKRIREEHERGEIPITPSPLEYPEPPTPFVEEPSTWNQVRDEAVNVLEEEPLYYALHQINSMTQEEVEERVKKDGYLTEEEYGKEPAKYRGKFVSITGTLIELEDIPLKPDNRSGVNRIWTGILYNQQNKNFRRYYFYVIRKDTEYVTETYCNLKGLSRRGDLVRLDGVFAKLYRTEVEGGGAAIMTYPFIIGRELVKVQEPTYTEMYPWIPMSIISAVLALVFGVIFISARRDRRADTEFKKELHHKLKKRVDDEFIKAHSKKHKTELPGKCGKEVSEPESEPTSGENPAATQPKEPEN